MHTGHCATDTTTSRTATPETSTGQVAAPVQIRRAEHEPELAGAVPPTVACPHCGGPVSTTTTADAKAPGGTRDDVEHGQRPVVDAVAVRVALAQVLRLILEVIDGRRPSGHLDSLATPSVLRYVRATRPMQPRRGGVLRSVRVCCPVEQVAEVAAVITFAGRIRAVAARFEQDAGQRRCVAFRIL